MYSLSLDDLGHSNPLGMAAVGHEIGLKSLRLGLLRKGGFRAPSGLVIRAQAYDEISAQETIASRIAQAEKLPSHADAIGAVREGFLEASLPSGLYAEIASWLTREELRGEPLAVRSSAVGEDLPGGSFAGVYQSFLNVRDESGITSSILGCYASAWSPRSRAYRESRVDETPRDRMAVLISPLVRARASGVAFTCDPRTGDRNRVVVAANIGLGESVVQGLADPDEYTVFASTLRGLRVTSRIGSKKHCTVPASPSGTTLVSTEGKGSRPALTSGQIEELALLARRVEAALGDGQEPQDIEWALDQDGFVLLQARPVTGVGSVPLDFPCRRPIVWSNANVKDSYPAVQSKLGWDVLNSLFDQVLYATFSTAGVDTPEGLVKQKLIEGRPYLNWSALIAQFEAMAAEPAEIVDILGGHHPPSAPVDAESVPRRSSLRGRLRLLHRSLVAIRALKRDRIAIWNRVDRELKRGYDELSDEALLSVAEQGSDRIAATGYRMQLVNGIAGSAFMFLVRWLRRLGASKPRELASALCSDASDATTVELGMRLRSLASLAAKNPEVDRLLRSAQLDVNEVLSLRNAFADAFAELLEDFGHRGIYEMELAHPRWVEDPAYLLEGIKALLLSGASDEPPRLPDDARRLRRTFRQHPWNVPLTRLLVWATRRSSAQRENARSTLVKSAQPLRQIFLTLGNRLQERGILESPDDVFSCSWWDIACLIRTRWNGDGLVHVVQQRKLLRRQQLAATPPDVVLEAGEGASARTPAKWSAAPLGGQVLSGVGVCPGKAQGRAAKFAMPDEGDAPAGGFVLIAPCADPGWTPLLIRADGIVLEMGGYLSHCAIVAREFGIPTVVNVPGAMQRVDSDELLLVDGTHGAVYRQAGRTPAVESRVG